MAQDRDLVERHRLHWRRSLFVGCGLLAAYVLLDLRAPDGDKAAAWRMAWIAVLAATGFLQLPERPRLARAATWAAAAFSGLAAPVIVHYTGGSLGPRFGFLQALPLVVLLLLPHLPSAALLTGAGCLAGGFATLARDGRDLWFVLEWGVLSVALVALAVIGSTGFRRVWISELRAQRARREAQEQLQISEQRRARAERLALAGRLAAGVAHEINNPLSFVKANVHFATEAPLARSPEVADALSDALEGIRRIDQIVQDMRGLAREGQESSEVLAVEDAVAEAWRLAAPRLAGVRGSWAAAPALPAAFGSRRLLVQALLNLMANAGEAAESAADPQRRWVSVTARADGDQVQILVEDGGPGLSAEVQARLFEPFHSTKGSRGTGLGLAMVREQVGSLGGTVEGRNRPGGGACFEIRLPIHRRPDRLAPA